MGYQPRDLSCTRRRSNNGYCIRAQFTCDGAALRSLARPGSLLWSRETFRQRAVNLRSANVGAMDFLQTDAHPGDVVLPAGNLIAPVLAFTKCRVPVGYFSFSLVARSEYTRRETAEKKFWNDWRLGKVEDGLLRDANVRYVVVNKQTEGIPATIPASLSNVFENSEFAVFKVDPQRLSETVPKTL